MGRHSFKIYPRESRECRVEWFSLALSPNGPLLWQKDVEDNSVAIANLGVTTQVLSVESDVVTQPYSDNPFDFILEDDALDYPRSGTFAYTLDENNLLEPYRVLPPEETCKQLTQWIASVWKKSDSIQTHVLLERLCRWVTFR